MMNRLLSQKPHRLRLYARFLGTRARNHVNPFAKHLYQVDKGSVPKSVNDTCGGPLVLEIGSSDGAWLAEAVGALRSGVADNRSLALPWAGYGMEVRRSMAIRAQKYFNRLSGSMENACGITQTNPHLAMDAVAQAIR